MCGHCDSKDEEIRFLRNEIAHLWCLGHIKTCEDFKASVARHKFISLPVEQRYGRESNRILDEFYATAPASKKDVSHQRREVASHENSTESQDNVFCCSQCSIRLTL